jgi:hypothetical protein
MSRPYVALLVGIVAGSAALWSQEDAPLKARELFYKPLNAAPVSQPAAPAVKTPKKTTAVVKKNTAAPAAASTGDVQVDARVPQVRNSPSAGVTVTMATYAPPQPLGLKYTILKQSGDLYRQVDADTEFHTGDHIRINVEANDTAYLYIVMQGSSGLWKPLFPNPSIMNGNNRIERGKAYQIPPAQSPAFYFDEQPGTEKVSLILTRTPEEDLEKLIYATGERNKGSNNEGKTMLAKNTAISQEVMGQVQQQMLSRDLVFEKVDETSSDGKSEKAVYAATPDTSSAARVFVDLKLIHK